MTVKQAVLASFLCIGLLSPDVWAQTAPASPLLAPPAGVISGNDIGFRVDVTNKGRAIGRLMVRVNGVWMEAEFSARGGVVPLGHGIEK